MIELVDDFPASVTTRYPFLEFIGGGTYGSVWRAKRIKIQLALKSQGTVQLHIQPAERVAIKALPIKEPGEDGSVSCTTLREIALLSRLSLHENIVTLHAVLLSDGLAATGFAVLDLMSYDLKALLNARFRHGMPRRMIASTMRQVLEGLAYIHDAGVIHRDLKPQNILVDAEGIAKLADFGLARMCPLRGTTLTPQLVTRWYRAPEILLGETRYAAPVDMWSFGCVLAECVNNQPLFAGDSEIGMLMKIFRTLGAPNEQVWPDVGRLPHAEILTAGWGPTWKLGQPLTPQLAAVAPDAVKLLERLLVYNPAARIDAHAALRHSFFGGCSASVRLPPTAAHQPAAAPARIDETPPPTPSADARLSAKLAEEPPSKIARYLR